MLEAVPLKVRDVLKLLERHGWRLVRTTGDHRISRVIGRTDPPSQ
ncbi:MAG: addiction module toxin, HicA family [Acidimicrobiia bacterium]|nr:addiction module toxin, HicA family [Acidimicrobiia bacterium]